MRETIKTFATACQMLLAKSHEIKQHGQYTLHHAGYYDVKERTGLQANYVVRAIKRVSASFGRGKKLPKEFKPTSLDLDARVMAYDPINEMVSLLYQPARLAEPLCCSYGQHGENALHAAASSSTREASTSAWSS
jgi:hypothetical protein